MNELIEIPKWYGWYVLIAGGICIAGQLYFLAGKYPRQKPSGTPLSDGVVLALSIVLVTLWIYWWPR